MADRGQKTARADWEQRIGRRTGVDGDVSTPVLPAPLGVEAAEGRGQVTLSWLPVTGAIGYVVYRSPSADGPWEPVDFGGGDVLALPHPPFTDTTGKPGETAWYAVAAIPDVRATGPLSRAVAATPQASGSGQVWVAVDTARPLGTLPRPWRPMIGSEHLSHLLSTDRTGGRRIGEELSQALRLVHQELGVQAVRAHGILCDDLGVYREIDDVPLYDFSGVDRVYDHLLDLGLVPVVELSFMPRDLARDPDTTVFEYGAIVSPPKDWDRWRDLVSALVRHLVERYGLDEVRDRWSFEVWNEANLEVFWSGTQEEYFRLYDVAARAIKDVDPGLVVGGPSSAAAGWVDETLAHVGASGAPLDFLSTHTYGAPVLDLRPALERHGRVGTPLWWTEWGTTPTHFKEIGDEVFAAAFLLRGMRSAAGRLEALSHWVASDHFEELGRPPSLLHGGFGLLTVGNLRKPRYWALAMLERLGDDELPVVVEGDGAGGMVEAWAARDDRGRVGVLVWNGALDQSRVLGDPELERQISLRVDGLSESSYEVHHWRIDSAHSNITALWRAMSEGTDWPTEGQWTDLVAGDRLGEMEPSKQIRVGDGGATLDFSLPMPGVSLVELAPEIS